MASKLVERETLNEPSLEKATLDYRATWGTSNDLRTVRPFHPQSLELRPAGFGTAGPPTLKGRVLTVAQTSAVRSRVRTFR